MTGSRETGACRAVSHVDDLLAVVPVQGSDAVETQGRPASCCGRSGRGENASRIREIVEARGGQPGGPDQIRLPAGDGTGGGIDDSQ